MNTNFKIDFPLKSEFSLVLSKSITDYELNVPLCSTLKYMYNY